MGLAATAAKLLASLDLDTKPFERGAKRASGIVGGMEKRFGKLGGIAAKGVGNLATNLTKIGIVAASAITVAVKSGIQSLADLERVQNATAAVIESTGGAAGVSAVQIREMAEALESVTTADDKVIQGGQNLLLTFTNIGKDVFPQATKSMVDLGIAMAQGDVANADFKSSAIQIGKALNDPIRGITALRRVGVSFTKDQEALIKKMVESGDVMGAQKLILGELEREFGKAGEAAGKGFGGDLRRLDDAFEDSRMALATGFLPVIRKVADKLSTELVKPEVQQQIKDFGVTLAGAFDRVLEIGSRLPWAQIGDSLKIAGAGAKAVFDAFAGMPAWVQTAVLTGWGLNKLSGGALTGLVGEGIKIAFKEFAGRGASPANPLWVASAQGGVGGTGGTAVAGGGGLLGTLLVATGIGALVGYEIDRLEQINRQLAAEATDKNVNTVTPKSSGSGGLSPDERQEHNDTQRKLENLDTRLMAVRDRARDTKAAVERNRIATVAATRTGDAAVVAAIRGIQRPIVNVNVSQTMTRITYSTGTTLSRYAGKLIPTG